MERMCNKFHPAHTPERDQYGGGKVMVLPEKHINGHAPLHDIVRVDCQDPGWFVTSKLHSLCFYSLS